MYEVTSNQKEQLLNQMLNALTNTTAHTAEGDRQFLLSMYEKVQRLRLGQSLSVKDALKLKKLNQKSDLIGLPPLPKQGRGMCI